MAKMYYPLYGCIEQKVAIVPVVISLAADASVSSFQGKGVESVEKSDTGEYTVTLKDKYNKLLSVGVGTLSASVIDVFSQVKSQDVSNKEVVVMTNDGTDAADTAVAHEIHLTLALTKSSVA